MANTPPVAQAPAPTTHRKDEPPARPTKHPEAVRYLLGAWAVMILGELLHQILSVVVTVLDPAALREAAKQAAKNQSEALPDNMMQASMYATIVLMALLQLGIIVVFVLALRSVQRRGKWILNATRVLQVFSVFFALRMLTLFLMTPAATKVPIALFAVDGATQIVVGVAGLLGLFYASRKESQDYLRPAEQQQQ